MQNLITRLARAAGYAPATKAAPTTVTFYGEGRPVWSAREPAAFAREGYARNAVAHRSVRLVAEAAASLPLTLAGADDDHPLIALLTRPNSREGGTRFLEGVFGHLMVSGNAALWSKCTKGRQEIATRRSAPGRLPGLTRGSSMSFVQRELDHIRAALLDPQQSKRHAELYAAQQALSWALDPEGAKSPFQMLVNTDTQEGSRDYSAHSRPPSS